MIKSLQYKLRTALNEIFFFNFINQSVNLFFIGFSILRASTTRNLTDNECKIIITLRNV